MTTTTLAPERPTSAPQGATSAPVRTSTSVRTTTDRIPLLALVAPLLLFAHGIVAWVDGLDALDGLDPHGGSAALGGLGGLDGLGGLGGLAAAHDQGALSVAAGLLLVLSVGAFAWLTASLGARVHRLPVAVPMTLLAAFGAGATAAVWLGRLTGLLGDTAPSALSSGGEVLAGLALAVVLVALVLEARLPVGSFVLAGVAAAVLLLPWGLGPLASLILLIALAPLTRHEADDSTGRDV